MVSVLFLGIGKSHNDAASVRTPYPIPAACGLYYFEVKIISKGRDGYMGIGLTAQNFKMNRLPGNPTKKKDRNVLLIFENNFFSLQDGINNLMVIMAMMEIPFVHRVMVNHMGQHSQLAILLVVVLIWLTTLVSTRKMDIILVLHLKICR